MEAENWKQALRKRFQREKPLKLVVILGICGIALIGLSSFWEPGSTAGNPIIQQDDEPRRN